VIGKLDIGKLPSLNGLQSGLTTLSATLNSVLVFYILNIIAAVIFLFASLCTIFFEAFYFKIGNLCLSIIAFLSIFISSTAITIIQTKITSLVNKIGESTGINVLGGQQYLAVTWSSVVLFGINMCICLSRIVLKKRYARTKGHGLKVCITMKEVRNFQ
jgi:hypothetical protein